MAGRTRVVLDSVDEGCEMDEVAEGGVAKSDVGVPGWLDVVWPGVRWGLDGCAFSIHSFKIAQ